MNAFVTSLLICLVASSAFGITDPEPNLMGVYFDKYANNNYLFVPPNISFDAYLILTNTTAIGINAYELGLDVVVPSGMENMFFMLESNIANGAVNGINVGENDALGGDYIVGLATPIPFHPALILHSWKYMLLTDLFVEFYIHAATVPSIPGNYPIVQDSEGSILMQTGVSGLGIGHGPDLPTAVISGIVNVEKSNFGSVKALYR
jgi:hypothetical protein